MSRHEFAAEAPTAGLPASVRKGLENPDTYHFCEIMRDHYLRLPVETRPGFLVDQRLRLGVEWPSPWGLLALELVTKIFQG